MIEHASDAAPPEPDPAPVLKSFTPPVTALVCGASRGIGLALVNRLLADPSVERVFATSRRLDVQPPRANAGQGAERRAHGIAMDVTDEDSVAHAAATVRASARRLDLIINCAGLLHDGVRMQPEKRLAEVTPANLARSFAVNAIGPVLIAKHFQGLLHREQRVVFANLSARVGSIGDNRLGGWYGYRASKAAQNMFTRNLSIELRRRARGLVCVALHPGTVDTGLSRPFRDNVDEARLFSPDRAARALLGVIDGLGPEDNGGFFAWDAQPIPW